MWHEPVDIVHRQVVALSHIHARGEHVGHGVLVDVAAVLLEEVLSGVDGFVRCGEHRSAGRHDQVVATLAVDMEHGVDHARTLLGRLNEHSGCAVAEEGAGAAVLIVDHRRHLLGGHDYHLLAKTRADVGRGVFERYDKSGACGLDVVGVAVGELGFVGDHRTR